MADEVVATEAPVVPEAAPVAVTPAPSPTPEPSFYSGNVPKELESQYKEMQASFTRSQQSLSRERMELRRPVTAPSPSAAPEPTGDVDPNISRMESDVRGMKLELMNTQIDRFAETHKDVYEHAAEMADMMLEVPKMTMEKAYWAVKGPKAEQEGRMSAMKTLQAKMEVPSVGPIGKTNVPAAPKVFNTIAEATRDAYNTEASRASQA